MEHRFRSKERKKDRQNHEKRRKRSQRTNLKNLWWGTDHYTTEDWVVREKKKRKKRSIVWEKERKAKWLFHLHPETWLKLDCREGCIK
jgi:hypothetical protein